MVARRPTNGFLDLFRLALADCVRCSYARTVWYVGIRIHGRRVGHAVRIPAEEYYMNRPLVVTVVTRQ